MADRPNLIFIFSDRQRFDTMACYGNDWIKTPHLNALAQESFVFENCYVTQPVCAPARSSIMTGLFPHATGLPVNKRNLHPDLKTIAEMVPGRWVMKDRPARSPSAAIPASCRTKTCISELDRPAMTRTFRIGSGNGGWPRAATVSAGATVKPSSPL